MRGGPEGGQEVVRAAVNQSGRALRYAEGGLKADGELVLEAVRQDSRARQYAAEALQDDPEIVMAAAQNADPKLLRRASAGSTAVRSSWRATGGVGKTSMINQFRGEDVPARGGVDARGGLDAGGRARGRRDVGGRGGRRPLGQVRGGGGALRDRVRRSADTGLRAPSLRRCRTRSTCAQWGWARS